MYSSHLLHGLMVRPPTKTHVVQSSLRLSALYLFLPNVRDVGSRRTSSSRFQMCFATIPLLASFACISAKRSGCRREAHELVTFLTDVLQPSSCLSALHVFLPNARAEVRGTRGCRVSDYVLQPSLCLAASHVFLPNARSEARGIRACHVSEYVLQRFSACRLCMYFCQTFGL